MSRSYRKPYANAHGTRGAKPDRQEAARSVRRTHKQILHEALSMTSEELEDLCLPDQLECSYNDPWGWNRDGHLHLIPEPEPESPSYPWTSKFYNKITRK